MRRPLRLIALVSLAAGAFAAEPLPQSEPDDGFEIEPPLLIPNRDSEPVTSMQAAGTAAAAPAPDIEKLEKDLRRAERSAAGADHLYKIGVIAKADAENRLLRVIRLRAELAKAQLAMAKDQLMQLQSASSAGTTAAAGDGATANKVATKEPSPGGEQLHEAEATLAHAIQAAHAAEAEREKADLAAAETNLERQRKLLALGSGRKSEVARAEQKLAELKAPKEE